MRNRWTVAVVAMFCSTNLWADIFHYNNIIVGDRAMGLGGAYTAIADDASGVYYNPGGLGFALSNDISGSANAFYTKRLKYKKTLGDADFTEQSGGSMAPFFGGLQKLDNISPGLVAAFGIATLDSDLKDQNDIIYNRSFNQKAADGSTSTAYLERMHRAVNQRAATNSFSGAIAKRFSGSFSMGIGVSYQGIDELVQEYQDNQVGASASDSKRTQIVQNIRQILSAGILEPSLGIQWAFSNSWSVGFTLKAPMNLFQSLKTNIEKYAYSYQWRCYYVDASGTTQAATAGKKCDQAIADSEVPAGTTKMANKQYIDTGTIDRTEADSKVAKPLGAPPMEARTGFAWFASPRLLMSFDVMHKMAADKGDYAFYKREAVTNFALGSEYYLTPSLPIRFGLFTNNDSRPDVQEGKANQPDHVDYMGTSLFLAWAQPNSQVALGAVVQNGSGKAQKLGGYNVQDIEAFSGVVAFSATHQF